MRRMEVDREHSVPRESRELLTILLHSACYQE